MVSLRTLALGCAMLLVTAGSALGDDCAGANRPSSIWSLDTIYKYFRAELDANNKRYEQRFTAAEKEMQATASAAQRALDTAATATEKRFDTTNEWRKTVSDMLATTMSRTEALSMLNGQQEQVGLLRQRLDRLEGRFGGYDSSWTYIVGGLALLVTLGNVFVFVRGKPGR